MKLYCLAAASLMLLGAAVAEEPNLRGVADTFKEQVAEALGNPDDIEMYERCTFDACCSYEDSEDSEDIKMYQKRCSCPWKKHEMCGGGNRAPPRPPQPHERGGCAHCEDCEGVDEASDSFLTYCKGWRFKRRCIRRGCISGDDGPPPPPKPQPRKPAHHDNGCGNLSRHCFDCYCNEEGEEEPSVSFLSYCDPSSCPDHCLESFDCDGGEERGHGGPGGPPHGPPNSGGGCSRYNGNPARCAMNGCLPRGPSQCGPREDSGDVEMEDFPDGEEYGGPDDNEGEDNDYGWPDEDEDNDYESGDGDDYDEDEDNDYESEDGYGYDESDGYQEGAREAMAHGEEQSGCGRGGCP